MGRFKTLLTAIALRMRVAVEDLRAYRRDERRVQPVGVRGRVYAGREPEPTDGVRTVSSRGRLKVSAKIIRANGSVEDLGRIA